MHGHIPVHIFLQKIKTNIQKVLIYELICDIMSLQAHQQSRQKEGKFMSDSSFNGDTILARKDGRTMKPIVENSRTNAAEFKREITEPEKTNAHIEEHDGLNTNIRCRWCGEKIQEMYIPKLKNGRDGKPYDIIVNYEPCEKCRKNWNTMVICIETSFEEPYEDCLPISVTEREIPDGYIDRNEHPEEYKRRVIKEIPQDEGMYPVQIEKVPLYPTGRYTGVELDAIKQKWAGSLHMVPQRMSRCR